MQKRIIFLDVSGSVCFGCGELWEIAKTVLKACLTQDKNLDTYVCLFSSEVKLLNEKELQQLFDEKDIFNIHPEIGKGSELNKLLEFFPIDFIKDAKIEVISDFFFNDQSEQEAKILMQKSWEERGNAKVTFYNLDAELVKLLTIAKQELETEKKEEKTTEKTFEPTIKGKV